jgi:carbamate kinase
MEKLVVVAIGGNSLIKDPAHQSVSDQYAAICETVGYIVDIIENGYITVITHGNGPQVGFILRRSEIAYRHEGLHFVPMVSCVADTQGALGYQIQQALKKISVKEITNYMAEGHFADGSMLPKIKAALEFLDNGGTRVIITSPHLLNKAMRGEAGTCIYNEEV